MHANKHFGVKRIRQGEKKKKQCVKSWVSKLTMKNDANLNYIRNIYIKVRREKVENYIYYSTAKST